ncbi:MAG: oxygen-independent coproporphyrinogen III oxidase [Chitinophagaceae bacterium]|nr:oxygen-independent coproporphyrinogen III oxidase [Chitinophagaceae bacterium]
MTQQSLVSKYNVPGPRYTSYPTVPYWDETDFSVAEWQDRLVQSFVASNSTEGISLYLHLPFCESLCTFCGCHKRITKRHDVEQPYITALLREWALYCALLPQRPRIKEIHLGGGTPTFFSVAHLQQLIEGILALADKADGYQFSFEGHPNNTTRQHLQALYELGFRRVSYGVQDYSPRVQQAIHRIQPFDNVARATKWAREIGYTSISHDLVFGLPFQTLEDVLFTIAKTKELAPDRLAFYSYAHVPWIKGNGQRGFKDDDVPRDDAKRILYEEGKKLLAQSGYHEIGMDHFALTTDELYESFAAGKLHRNFMGYTTTNTQVMIGLGVSAIGDTWSSFAQNEKSIEHYYELLAQGILPVVKGHLLTTEDLIIRRHILNLMCRFDTTWHHEEMQVPELKEIVAALAEMEKDQILIRSPQRLQIPDNGKAFVRNICMAFDLRMRRKAPDAALFSMTI